MALDDVGANKRCDHCNGSDDPNHITTGRVCKTARIGDLLIRIDANCQNRFDNWRRYGRVGRG